MLSIVSMMLITVGIIPVYAAPTEVTATQIGFDVVYAGDVLPEDSGFFKIRAQEACTLRQITPDDTFHMITTSSGECIYHPIVWNPDPSVGFTVEAKVKVNSYVGNTGLGGIGLWAGTPSGEAILLFTTNSIKEVGSGKSYSMNTTDDFHTYRVTVLGNFYTIYVDGVQKISGTASNFNRTLMSFGDGSHSAGGNSQWSCIAYTTLGTFNPTQLPSPSCIPQTAPIITSLIADDSDDLDDVYSRDDTITITFDLDTDTPGGDKVQRKPAIDDMFTFSESLGRAYSGKWVSPDTFIITIHSDNNASPPVIGITTVIPSGITPILTSDRTSEPSSDISPVLSGNFGIIQ